MTDFDKISVNIQEKLGMELSPVGVFLPEKLPEYAMHLNRKNQGCLATRIYTSAKGKVIAFDEHSTGRACASFYLGYSEWIFPGIEKFLSHETVNGREPERFLKNPEIAKECIEYYVPKEKRNTAIIFKPLELFSKDEKPELVIFFANPDQLSALVFLITYEAPLEERIDTRFASACMSMFTIPLKYAEEGKKKAVWGFHDISARKTIPRDLMSLTMTFDLFREVYGNLGDSFVTTETWEKLRSRNL
jgi:hypothetical protein